MNAIITVENPFPDIESIKIYKSFKGDSNSRIFPVKINDTLSNVRFNKNAMWADKAFADNFSDEVLNFVGNLINSN